MEQQNLCHSIFSTVERFDRLVTQPGKGSLMNAQQLDGKVAYITGAASGAGAATARRLVAAGAKVVVADVDESNGKAVAASIGNNAVFMMHDITNEDDWKRNLQATVDQFGALHILVNCAGITLLGNIVETSYEHWRRAFSILADGMYMGCHHGVKTIEATSPLGGSIVNISSPQGERVASNLAAYGAAKAAGLNLTRSVALYCAEASNGIRCNSVLPGGMLTAMTEDFISDAPDREEAIKGIAAMHPMKRVCEPEEVAEAVLYLASDASSFVTGINLPVDGGYLAQ
jgi:3(or 17)beta-hydroxysteroid dehydrogenase